VALLKSFSTEAGALADNAIDAAAGCRLVIAAGALLDRARLAVAGTIANELPIDGAALDSDRAPAVGAKTKFSSWIGKLPVNTNEAEAGVGK